LLQKWRLLRSELNQLLKLLKLRWDELQELLHLSQLLLLQHLQLLELLRHRVKELQNLLKRLGADSVSCLARERLTELLRNRRDAEWLAPVWSEAP
jgi:hypothetical protein